MLNENTVMLAGITGKTGEEALAEAMAKAERPGFFDRLFNRKTQENTAAEEYDENADNEITEDAGDSSTPEITDSPEEDALRETDEKVTGDILEWEGERGNSLRFPKDTDGELAAELRKFGVEGIEYRQGDVDFTPVAVYEIEFTDQEQLYYKIGSSIPVGKLETRQDLNKAVRTEWQSIAKQQIIESISENSGFAAELQEKTGIDVSRVTSENALTKELSRVGLTMHETPDCSRIQFVPTKIHEAFKHSGGTSEMLERQLSADLREYVDQKINK